MFITANRINVHVQVSGPADAPALLLLHSLGTEAAIWEDPAAHLAAHWRVIRPDLRGHGLSDVTPGPYSVTGMAQDMLGVLDGLAVEQAHVAGVSIGGMIAMSMAVQAPARVASLCLVDTALCIPPARSWRERAALVRAEGMAPLIETVVGRWVTAASLDTPNAHGLRQMLRTTPAEGYAAAAEAIADEDLTLAARSIKAPTLVLVGDQDMATPPSSAEAIRDTIAGAGLSVIPDAAHIPTMERGAAVTAAMTSFLSTQASAGG
jgi:3-oxoadipate enol-lactonase/4-carboxymuconolactone decarboxylase